MSWEAALFLYMGLLFVFLMTGAPIGVALGLTGLIGISIGGGTHLWQSLGDVLWNGTNSFNLVAVPLFVFMGEIILRTGVSRRFYSALAMIMSPFPGRLALANIVSCSVFAAFCGSSVATALTMGTVAIPEMKSRGYSPRLTAGSLAAGGSLGILIPPSIPLIIYASMVNESVVDLFMAGIIPGLLLATIFLILIVVQVKLKPKLVPSQKVQRPDLLTILRTVGDSWAVAALVMSIIGGMYFGVVTPTEAAALGCAISLLIGVCYREITWAKLIEATVNSVSTTCVVMFIIVNGLILSFAVVDAGISRGLSSLIVEAHLASWQFFAILFVLYLILGMFLEGISMMLLTLPVLYPSVVAFGFDGIWFGVILVIFIELAALTPPMGLNLFAVQSVSGGWPMAEVVKGSAPFALAIAAFSFLLFLFPEIVLWLPETMRTLQGN